MHRILMADQGTVLDVRESSHMTSTPFPDHASAQRRCGSSSTEERETLDERRRSNGLECRRHPMSTEGQFLVTLIERLRPLQDPVQIQDVIVRLIGEHLQASRVNYAQIEGNEFVIRRSYARGAQPSAGRRPVA